MGKGKAPMPAGQLAQKHQEFAQRTLDRIAAGNQMVSFNMDWPRQEEIAAALESSDYKHYKTTDTYVYFTRKK